MRQFEDPKQFGLTASTRLYRNDRGDVVILIDRKSRIVMKDGERILEKANRIQSFQGNARVKVETTAPVCSKTRAFLAKHDIAIEPVSN